MPETNSPKAMTLHEAAKSVGMPDAIPGDVRTSAGKAEFSRDIARGSLSDNEIDGMIAARSAERGDNRRHNMGRRIAVGLAATGALLAPQIGDAVEKVQDKVVDVARDFNENLDNDRVFNPDQGNPANAAEIVSTWSEDPTQSVVTVETPRKGGPDTAETGSEVVPQVSPEAQTIEREAESQ